MANDETSQNPVQPESVPASQEKSTKQQEDWREIAARAANETDPGKLLRLVEQLCSHLEDRDSGNNGSRS